MRLSHSAIVHASKGLIWFRIGEPFEESARALKSYQPELNIVDMRKSVDLIHTFSRWLFPKLLFLR